VNVPKTLETPKELADRVGLPVTNIRYLIREEMLDHIFTAPGKRNPKIPTGAWERYLQEFTIKSNYTALSKPRSAAKAGGKNGDD
jgi:hypothetical protein